jgi:hypothetical protein
MKYHAAKSKKIIFFGFLFLIALIFFIFRDSTDEISSPFSTKPPVVKVEHNEAAVFPWSLSPEGYASSFSTRSDNSGEQTTKQESWLPSPELKRQVVEAESKIYSNNPVELDAALNTTEHCSGLANLFQEIEESGICAKLLSSYTQMENKLAEMGRAYNYKAEPIWIRRRLTQLNMELRSPDLTYEEYRSKQDEVLVLSRREVLLNQDAEFLRSK